jgi:hypothetical protein
MAKLKCFGGFIAFFLGLSWVTLAFSIGDFAQKINLNRGCAQKHRGANWYTRRENVEISTGMGIWLISLLFPAPAIINQCRFSAVAFSAQRLQVAIIIGPAARLRKPVVNRV